MYQTFKLLGYIDKNIAFSELWIKALKNIKFCAITISVLYAAIMPFFYLVAEIDDAPGVLLIGSSYGITPNRMAVLGMNLLVFIPSKTMIVFVMVLTYANIL